MEEMNKEIMENGAIEMVEEVTEKLTFGQNLGAYALAGTFIIGVGTIGYFIGKGGKKMYDKIKSKNKNVVEESDEEIVDVEHEDIHEVRDDESEEK